MKITFTKFSGTWCGPCQQLAPIVDKIKSDYTDIEFVDIDVDDKDNSAKVAAYGVRSIPVVFIEKDGEIVDKFVGMKSEKDIRELLDKY